ncbi:sperm-specific H1/protamine-like protein type 2 [Ptychodera flava]|uniref:sperm-specific H1/protamine-like protein type 2 n=1 Tax=Ptychodera flava TaxID=63121 RepID=UPI003969DAC8
MSAASPKKKKATKARAKPTHPKTIDMVVAAIKALKDAKGSSLQGIRNYIKANYPTVQASHLNSSLRRAVKTGLASGVLVRPKGDTSVGATGRFRVGKPPAAAKPKKKKVVKKKAPKKKKPAKKAKAPKKPKAKTAKKKTTKKAAKKSPKKKAAAKPKKKAAAKKPAKKAKKPAKKAGAKKAKK